MNPATIDYEPLDSMNKAGSIVMRTALHGLAWPIAIVIVILGIVLAIITKVIFFFFIPPVLFIVYIGRLTQQYKNNAWERFATTNGWDYDLPGTYDYAVPASLQFGHSPHYSPIIHAQLASGNCDLFMYDCTVSYGKSSVTYFFTVALRKGPKSLPHMILRNTRNNMYIKNDITDMEDYQLEGDFQDYFKLQIEKGQEVDVLTVITPDIMQALVNYDVNEDIEIVDDNIYFMLSGDKRDPDDVRKLIGSVVNLSDRLTENVRLSNVQTATAQPAVATAPEVIMPTSQAGPTITNA